MSSSGKELGMLFIGVAIGTLIPSLPEPLTALNTYLWLIFFAIGVVLFVKG